MEPQTITIMDELSLALSDRRLRRVSSETGINPTTLGEIAAGKGNPTLKTLERLTIYLGLTITIGRK